MACVTKASTETSGKELADRFVGTNFHFQRISGKAGVVIIGLGCLSSREETDFWDHSVGGIGQL